MGVIVDGFLGDTYVLKLERLFERSVVRSRLRAAE